MQEHLALAPGDLVVISATERSPIVVAPELGWYAAMQGNVLLCESTLAVIIEPERYSFVKVMTACGKVGWVYTERVALA